jgi:hypothetical protein
VGWDADHTDWNPASFTLASFFRTTISHFSFYAFYFSSVITGVAVFLLFGVKQHAATVFWQYFARIMELFGWKLRPRAGSNEANELVSVIVFQNGNGISLPDNNVYVALFFVLYTFGTKPQAKLTHVQFSARRILSRTER